MITNEAKKVAVSFRVNPKKVAQINNGEFDGTFDLDAKPGASFWIMFAKLIAENDLITIKIN